MEVEVQMTQQLITSHSDTNVTTGTRQSWQGIFGILYITGCALVTKLRFSINNHTLCIPDIMVVCSYGAHVCILLLCT